ncbi:MAG: hypothetical protein CMQ24_06070 [Gammaproteobacteria bacterium]|nr:hypothetical protein [Gammaproteobacteria bacterium]
MDVTGMHVYRFVTGERNQRDAESRARRADRVSGLLARLFDVALDLDETLQRSVGDLRREYRTPGSGRRPVRG